MWPVYLGSRACVTILDVVLSLTPQRHLGANDALLLAVSHFKMNVGAAFPCVGVATIQFAQGIAIFMKVNVKSMLKTVVAIVKTMMS